MLKKEAPQITIKKFDELSADFALKCCKDDPACMMFVPDEWLKPGHKICRKYLWKVLAKVHPDFVDQLYLHALKLRDPDEQNDPNKQPM